MRKIGCAILALILICCVGQSNIHGNEGDLQLDPEATGQSENENIQSTQYNGFDFFSDHDIQKSKTKAKEERTKQEQLKNKIFLKKKKKQTNTYDAIEGNIFHTMFVYSQEEETQTNSYIIYITILVMLWILACITAVYYYKKKKEKRGQEHDYVKHMYGR